MPPAASAPPPFTIERKSAEPPPSAPTAPKPRVIEDLPPSLVAISRALISDDPVGEPSRPALSQSFGVIKVVSGAVDGHTEIKLKELVTYIGTSDKAAIKIKGLLAPSLAAAISRRPEGYFLKAVKAGYPKVNGNSVKEQVFLENGALIEAGGTNMVFYQTDAKKEPPKQETPPPSA
jgi:hypothetical protein